MTPPLLSVVMVTLCSSSSAAVLKLLITASKPVIEPMVSTPKLWPLWKSTAWLLSTVAALTNRLPKPCTCRTPPVPLPPSEMVGLETSSVPMEPRLTPWAK